ncbi:MAG: secretin N-terminal domain-containing protein, partial [Planctomycetota bacterium]
MKQTRQAGRISRASRGSRARVFAVSVPALLASAGLAQPVADAGNAEDTAGVVIGAVPAAGVVGVPAGQDEAAATRPEPRIRFNFSGASFDQVIDFFSRRFELPVIRETAAPDGTMSFVSAATYTLPEALEILNLNLGPREVRLVREENFLYLRSLADAARTATEVAGFDELGGIDPTAYVSVTVPLNNAVAQLVAEQIKPLIKEPGMVTAVPAQNLIVLIETAAQAKRIREIVQRIDAVRPVDSEYKVFRLRHAEPKDVVNALRGLVGQRIQKQIIEKDGSVRQVEEIDLAGLSIEPDERTGSIIAVGSSSRLETVEELVALLDQPEGGAAVGESRLATYRLSSATPAEASRQLEALFRGVPANRRPTMIPLDAVGKLVVVGQPMQLAQATALIGELDPSPGGAEPGPSITAARVIELEHVTARQLEDLARRMLSPRQNQVLRYAPAPSGQGLLVTGPVADVEALGDLAAQIDTPAETRREVRRVRIETGDPSSVLRDAARLDALTDDGVSDPVEVIADPEDRTATLVGSRGALDRFERLLRDTQRDAGPIREQRVVPTGATRPSTLAAALRRVAPTILRGDGTEPFTEPTFEPVDELDTLVVRALPEQFAAIDELIAQLGAERAEDRRLEIIPVRGADPQRLLDRAAELFSDRSEAEGTGAVETDFDTQSGSLIVRGTNEAVRLYTTVLRDAQRLMPPARTTRLVDVRDVEASSILGPLTELLRGADPIDPSREVPEPEVRVIERTNTLMVTAEDAQHRMIADYVRRLDSVERGELPPLKLLQLRTADVNAIARMLGDQYRSRPPAERAAKPVDVRADAATGTLIVSAHEDLFGEIRSFVDQLNDQSESGPERETFIFPLKVARATDVASAMDRLYPAPPVPVDRRGRPMPWLREPKEVTVSADASSNSLIIDAPAERRESLEQLAATLDTIQAPPQAMLRTYRIVNADLTAVSRMLTGLARRGTLNGPAQPGQQRVEVVIETEPRSGTLIVAGDERTFEQVDAILADLTAVPIERGLRIVPIANATAADVRDRALTIYAAQVAQIEGSGPVDVTIDEDSNSLEVVADTDAMRRFMGILTELQRQTGPAKQVRLIELRLAQADEVIGTLRELVQASETLRAGGGPAPVFEPVASTNSIMVAAQPQQFAIIEPIIRSLDNRQTADRPPLRVLRLRATDAGSIASVLQRSFDRRPTEERAKRPVEIQADAATNTLVVSAHPDVLPEINAIVTDLNDAQALDREGREIRIFPLKLARAEELARTIDQMYPDPPLPRDNRGRPMPWLQEPKEVVVRADAATNSLIVDAPAARLDGFEQLVQNLDTLQADEDIELRSYRIRTADLDTVAQTIRQLASGGALGPAGRTPVTVTTEPESRTLIVGGSSVIFDRVEEIIGEVSAEPQRPPTALRMYRLDHARADRVAELMRSLLKTRLRESLVTGGDTPADRADRLADELLEISADRSSNTLIINAPTEIQAIAEQLLESLDTEAAATGRSVIRVVPLTFAESRDVAGTVNQALRGMELPAGGPVTVSAAAGSNALLLTGAEADLAVVQELIDPLDRQPFDPEQPAIETFALEHADAETIARTVERLLIDQQQTDPRVLAMRLRFSRGRMLEGPRVRVEAEARTNSLVVSGPRKSVDLAKAVIERLDQPARQTDRTLVTFTPVRGEPAKLAESVRRVILETTTATREPIEIVVEPSTRSLIVIGTESQTADAARLLADFDDRTPAMPMVELRSFALANTDAGVVAGSVRSMLQDRSRWPAALRAAEQAGLPIPAVVPQADRDANRLVLSAPAVLMPMAAEIIEQLDQPRAGGPIEVRVFRLTLGDAESVARAVRDGILTGLPAGEAEPTVSAEPTSNSVVVSGSADRLATAATLIEAMDAVSAEPAEIGVRTIFLRAARAESVAPIVERVLESGDALSDDAPWWMRDQILFDRARRGVAPPPPPVRVQAEPRLNAVVVSAPLSVLDLAEEVIAGLDVDPTTTPGGGPGSRSVRVISLLNAEAAELAANIEAVFEAEQSFGPGGMSGDAPPTVRVDRGSNALIVSATTAQMREIERIAASIDNATLSTRREMRTIPIDRSRADAADVARTLERLLQQRGGVKVEVLSIDDLIGDGAQPGTSDAGASDSEPATNGGTPGSSSAIPRPSMPSPDMPSPEMPGAAMPAHTIAGGWRGTVLGGVAAAAMAQADVAPAGSAPAGLAQTGLAQTGLAQTGLAQAGLAQAGLAQAGLAQTGLAQAADASKNQPMNPPEADADEPTVTIAVDPVTNTLIVVGAPRVTEQLAALAEDIERELPAEPTAVRIVALPEGARSEE